MAAPTYLDSNVISYLTAWPSRDVVSLAHQQLTREWWDQQRHRIELHGLWQPRGHTFDLRWSNSKPKREA